MALDISEFKDYVRRRLGIELPDQSDTSLNVFLSSRVDKYKYSNVSEYLSKLLSSDSTDGELQKLVETVTNGKTSFFRHCEQLMSLGSMVESSPVFDPSSLCVWSAGCSTGEEAYSLYILFAERGIAANILGSDVDDRAIGIARNGIYDEWKLSGMSEDYVARYFEKETGGNYVVTPDVRHNVSFGQHNLMNSEYLTPESGLWDIVLCRNVMIYFSRATVIRVVKNLARVLKPGGILILSPTESLFGMCPQFSLLEHLGGYFYQKIDPNKPLCPPVEPFEYSAQTQLLEDMSCCVKDEGSILSPVSVQLDDEDNAAQTLQESEKGVTPGDDDSTRDDRRDVDNAVLAYQGGDKEYAIGRLEEYSKKHPNDVEALITLGNALVGIKDLSRAAEQYSLVLDIDPLSAETHFLLGMLHRKRANLDEAINEMKSALFLDRLLWLASFYLARLLLRVGKTAQAKQAYENTISNIDRAESASHVFKSGLHGLDDALIYKNDIKKICTKKLTEIGEL